MKLRRRSARGNAGQTVIGSKRLGEKRGREGAQRLPIALDHTVSRCFENSSVRSVFLREYIRFGLTFGSSWLCICIVLGSFEHSTWQGGQLYHWRPARFGVLLQTHPRQLMLRRVMSELPQLLPIETRLRLDYNLPGSTKKAPLVLET